MARLIPDKLRGKPGSALHHFRKVLKSLPDEFTAWFSVAADAKERPHVFLVWRERHAFLIQIAETSQQLAEAAIGADLFSSELIVNPADLGREESSVLGKFIASASEEFGPLAGALPVKKLIVFPNVHEHTIDGIAIQRTVEDDVCYLGLHQLDKQRFANQLEALAEAALTTPALFRLRKMFTPESIIPSDFNARREITRQTNAEIDGGFLDFDQEWCMKNDLDLLPDQREIVDKNSSKTRLVTGVAGSGKSLVLLYRALLSARLHPKARVLVLTHNRPLRFELERRSMRLENLPTNLECRTFFQWAKQHIGNTYDDVFQSWEIERTLEKFRRPFTNLEKFSTAFLTDEIGWIKDNCLHNKGFYQSSDRSGRGTRLTATQREELWQVFRLYQKHLDDQGRPDWHNVALRFHEFAVVQNSMTRRYDAIFVDEAQFFAKSWFEIVRAALKPGGHLFLAADPTQGFLRRRQSWIAAGINVRGRTTRLTHAYRNTRAILAYARNFYESRKSNEDGELDLNVPDDALLAAISEEGEAPTIIEVGNVQDEIVRATNECFALRENGLFPASLLVIHANSARENTLREALERKLGSDQVHDAKSGPMPQAAFCSVTTLNAATGLEAPVVMLLGMDHLLQSEEDPRFSPDERSELRRDHTRQLYMGFTRAGRRLIILRTQD